jgi:murein DD-endopeptidase MepM/ murein hydrolase activator NlpD
MTPIADPSTPPGPALAAPAASSAGHATGGGGTAAAQARAGAQHLLLPVGNRTITSHFGGTESIRTQPHTGTDYSAPTGTAIHAAAAGRVVFAGWAQGGGGNVVTIDHGNGYFTSYAHQSQILVRTGDVLDQGDVLGKVGQTGNATGPHLHFELLKGGTIPGRNSINAETFMANGGTV